jgi:hypothetical protein
MVSSRAYKKFSSNGLDLAELEPKQVDHHSDRPCTYLGRFLTGQLKKKPGLLSDKRSKNPHMSHTTGKNQPEKRVSNNRKNGL